MDGLSQSEVNCVFDFAICEVSVTNSSQSANGALKVTYLVLRRRGALIAPLIITFLICEFIMFFEGTEVLVVVVLRLLVANL